MSVVQKIILWFLGLSLLPLIIAGGLVYAGFNQTYQQNTESHLQDIAAVQQHRIEEIAQQNQERIVSFTGRQNLPVVLERYDKLHKSDDKDALDVLLKNGLTQVTSFQHISLVNPQGIVLASTNPDYENKDYSHNAAFLTGSQRRDSSHNFFTGKNGELFLYLSGPYKINNKLVGVVVIESEIKNLSLVTMDHTGLGETGEMALQRPSEDGGNVLLAPLRIKEIPLLQNFTVVKSSSQTYDYREKPVLAVTRSIKGTDWQLTVKIDKSEAFAPIAELRDTILILVFIILVCSIFMALFAARNLTEPILALSRAVDNMGKGDFKQRVAANSNDEIGKLGKAFNRMANSLDEINKTKSEFILLASHQLRTPLTAVRWLTEELTTPHKLLTDKKKLRYIQQINTSNKRMIDLVNELLTASKVELGRLAVNPEHVQASDALDQVLQDVATSLHKNKITVVKKVGNNLPTLYIDPAWLRIIFQNLITNAIKYSPPGQQIEINLQQQGQVIKLVVKDHGCGIPLSQQDAIFTKLFRADNARKLIGDGSGLGLYISKAMVEAAGGKIWFISEENEGSTFYVTLPVVTKLTS